MAAQTTADFLAATGCRLAFTSDGDYAIVSPDRRLLAQGVTVELAVKRARAALRKRPVAA